MLLQGSMNGQPIELGSTLNASGNANGAGLQPPPASVSFRLHLYLRKNQYYNFDLKWFVRAYRKTQEQIVQIIIKH